ncbi:MAG: polysaccharide deacetylase family protein [Pseudobdellovibrionaceae bacterium]|nr:MAG: polysaccharide deacetylase family protein [Pseudobdellovibrionaceae bacterium]
MKLKIISLFITLFYSLFGFAGEISITIDDPNQTFKWDLFSKPERDKMIRAALSRFQVKAALFVCGMRVDTPQGKKLLEEWDREGHLIANHTYSHKNYHGVSYDFFKNDILAVEPLLTGLKNYERYFRFPQLKAGNSKEKRDRIRSFFDSNGFKNGYVTVDASDWYIDYRLRNKINKDPKFDIQKFKNYYLKHIWERTKYYDQLAKKLTGRSIRHTLLIHHNSINALFLEDILKMYTSKGWKVIDAKDAFQDQVFLVRPNVVPAGESIIWSMAKEKGFSDLRYPAEDARYEKPEMDRLGL